MTALRILMLGAHPDDCDVHAGGLAALYRQDGHTVKFVSVTNGDAGHHKLDREALAARRYAETQRVSEITGILYDVLDIHDGGLEPTLARREQFIRLIREFKPDLLLTHRPNDYHPDHRYTSVLTQDAAFCITVPLICPDVPALPRNPVIAYYSDRFTKPVPFQPDLAFDITAVIDQKMEMLHCHASQIYEWIPYLGGCLDQVPASEEERRAFLYERWLQRSDVEPWRDLLIQLYGEDRGRQIRHGEAIEISEYGTPLDDEGKRRLFPFGPWAR